MDKVKYFIKPWFLSLYTNGLFFAFFWRIYQQQAIGNSRVQIDTIFLISSCLLSFFFYQIIYFYLKNRVGQLVFILLGALQGFVFLVTFITFYYFNSVISLNLLSFIGGNATLSFRMIDENLNFTNTIFIISVIAIFIYAWTHHDQRWMDGFKSKRKFAYGALAILVIFLSFNRNYKWNSIENYYLIRTYTDFKMLIYDEGPLRQGFDYDAFERLPLKDLNNVTAGSSQPNILFFRLEEVARNHFGLYFPEYHTTPNFENFAKRSQDEFFIYQKHFTNSGATDTSVPVIYTGLNPSRKGDDFLSYPLMWDYAKALGYHTFAILSYDLTFGHLDKKLASQAGKPSFDFLISSDDPNIDYAYDDAMSDELVNQFVKEHLRTISVHNQPFFGVINYNITHADASGVWVLGKEALGCNDDGDRFTVYQCGVYYTDQKISEIITELENLDLLKNTIIIWTSDHGTATTRLDPALGDRRNRLDSFYQEVLSIPLLMYIPKGVQRRIDEINPYWRNNINKVTSNVDLVPTVVDFLNIGEIPSIQQIVSQLDGLSLVRELPENRWVKVKNANDLRYWDPDGFALINYPYKYILDDAVQLIFNLNDDPGEFENLYPPASHAVKAFFKRAKGYIYADKLFIDHYKKKVIDKYHQVIEPLSFEISRGIVIGNTLMAGEKGLFASVSDLVLPVGQFNIQIKYSTPATELNTPVGTWDLVYSGEENAAALGGGLFETAKENTASSGEFEILLDDYSRPIDIRMYYTGRGNVVVRSIEIDQIN